LPFKSNMWTFDFQKVYTNKENFHQWGNYNLLNWDRSS
jgi:hypothetical protein